MTHKTFRELKVFIEENTVLGEEVLVWHERSGTTVRARLLRCLGYDSDARPKHETGKAEFVMDVAELDKMSPFDIFVAIMKTVGATLPESCR